MLTAARADGSSFHRDVAAVTLFRTLQRVLRFCADFAKVVSTSPPLPGAQALQFQDAQATIGRFESRFADPVMAAVEFDSQGRLVRVRSGVSQL
jgi:hypothetical protein